MFTGEGNICYLSYLEAWHHRRTCCGSALSLFPPSQGSHCTPDAHEHVASCPPTCPFSYSGAVHHRPPRWRMELQCVSLVAAFLLGVSSAACTRLPPSESMFASLRLPAWSSVHSWLLCLRSGSLSAPVLLPAPTPVLHMSAPVRRGAVADTRLGLA